jgi:hypothetical protein
MTVLTPGSTSASVQLTQKPNTTLQVDIQYFRRRLTMTRRIKRASKVGAQWLRNRSHPILIEVKTRLGIPARFSSPARALFENTIIPYYGSQNNSSVLFVGCDWYTNHYWRSFRNCDYWTIDPDPEKGRYGAKSHIVDFLENLGQYFDPEYFDVIICNGVLGFGLDRKEAAERAFSGCFANLRLGGTLVLGWDDSPTLVPFSIDELQSLKKFMPFPFPPLGTWNYSMKPQYDYVFRFLLKPESPNAP